MRNDTRSLLAKLKQPDFEYRAFDGGEAGRGYAWPLLDIVARLSVPPVPGAAGVATVPAGEEEASRDLLAAYTAPPRAPAPPAMLPPAGTQDLGSLLASYSGRR